MQNHTKNTRPLIATGAALALGIGTLAGIASPANASTGGVDYECAERGQTQKIPAGDIGKNPSLMPAPFSGAPAAGSHEKGLTQDKENPTDFTLTYEKEGARDLQNAPDGKYEVKIGDGTCGGTHVMDIKDGKLRLSNTELPDDYSGQHMIQVLGRVNPDASPGSDQRYLDEKGQPTDHPQLAEGAIMYTPNAFTVPLDETVNNTRNSSTGLPVLDTGTTVIKMGQRSAEAAPKDGATVDATFTDQNLKPVTAENVGTVHDEDGFVSIQGRALGELKSGRYTLTFTDEKGQKQNLFILLGDGDSDSAQHPKPLYAPPMIAE